MLKRDKADRLFSIAVRRYREELPEKELSKKEIDSIWYSIYGILVRDGEEKALEYASNAKLLS